MKTFGLFSIGSLSAIKKFRLFCTCTPMRSCPREICKFEQINNLMGNIVDDTEDGQHIYGGALHHQGEVVGGQNVPNIHWD